VAARLLFIQRVIMRLPDQTKFIHHLHWATLQASVRILADDPTKYDLSPRSQMKLERIGGDWHSWGEYLREFPEPWATIHYHEMQVFYEPARLFNNGNRRNIMSLLLDGH
jgi:hypothetical protein